MQVQTNACNFYPSNISPYSPVATGSVGTDSNNSSPESVYSEHRVYAQQRSYQSMDLSSPVSTHQHHHLNVQANRHHLQSARLQSFQTNLDVNNQYYAHQNFEGFSDHHLMSGSYSVNEQRSRFYPQQQQQQQQQPINRFGGVYSSPPTAVTERTFIQQQHHQHQAYAQPQLLPSQQYTANAQITPQQTYSEPMSTFAYAETTSFVTHPPVAVGKQQCVVSTVNRVKNNPVKNNKKRKALDNGDVTMQVTKIAKIEEPTTPSPVEGIQDIDDQRLTASMRERQRTQELNKAYSQLRQTIPCLPSDKLSKLQTVKLAKQYIEFLTNVVYYNAVPEAMKQTQASPPTAVIMAARDIMQSATVTPNAPPSHDKLSYAFSVWRMDNEMTGATRIE